MTALVKPGIGLTAKEYLAGELRSNVRHEYLGGHVYAMSGASRRHNIIAGNIFSSLRSHLRGKKCRAYIHDMKVRLPYLAGDVFYYPDVMVVCRLGEPSEYYSEAPSIIVEVLSKETESVDRREKLMAYTTIPTLKSYVIVDQYRRRMEVFRRSRGQWKHEILDGDRDLLRLPEIKFQMRLESIYEDSGI